MKEPPAQKFYGRRFTNVLPTAGLMFVATILSCGLAAGRLLAQQKLVFKDGSVEKVERYEVKGDRVRFKSLERNEWEEVPREQVDLEATEKLNKKEEEELKRLPRRPLDSLGTHSKENSSEATSADAVEVAPGVKLPPAYGLFAWDGKALTPLSEAETRQRKDRKRAIINSVAPAPLLKQKVSIQLEGATSDTPLHTSAPVFFVHLPDERGGQLSLFKMTVTGSARVLKEVAHSQITGRDTEKAPELIFTPSLRVTQNVFKIFPTKPLPEGEYCLLELTPQQNQLVTSVWDFTIVK